MKTISLFSTIHFQNSSNKILRIIHRKFKLYCGIILVVFLFSSCKGAYKSNVLAKEQFKKYDISDTLSKDEWGLKTYKSYNPTLYLEWRRFKTEGKNDFNYVFYRWYKGKDAVGNVKKIRVNVFVNIKRLENKKFEVSEISIGKIAPLTFTRQLITWLCMILFMFILSWATTAWGDFDIIFYIIIWYILIGFVSYNCFMSVWGILFGILVNVVVMILISYFVHGNRSKKKDIADIFQIDIKSLPDETFVEINRYLNNSFQEVIEYRKQLTYKECGIFDVVDVIIVGEDNTTVYFRNFTPDQINMVKIKELINSIYRVYGFDEEKKGKFNRKDILEYNDTDINMNFGRDWIDYQKEVVLFRDDDKIELEIWGANK